MHFFGINCGEKERWTSLVAGLLLLAPASWAGNGQLLGAGGLESWGNSQLSYENSRPAEAPIKDDHQKITIGGILELDKTIHDFGDVMMSEKVLHCSYQLKNISENAIVIYNVLSSCGCTNVKWTREPLAPGKTGTIQVDYTNDAGPYPFDKSLTVYVSGLKKPVILRLRGIVHEKKKPLQDIYPIHLGALGVKETEIKLGNIRQGERKDDSFKVANLGSSPIRLEFKDLTTGMEVNVDPATIPAQQTATVHFSIEAGKDIWGKNWYDMTPVVNGRSQKKMSVWSFTVEDFSGWSKEQINQASQPIFRSSSYTFPAIKAGAEVQAKFTFTNRGKSDAIIYKADCDWDQSSSSFQRSTKPGASSEVTITLDTAGMPAGEVMRTVLLTTNCPLRPYITLYIYGTIL